MKSLKPFTPFEDIKIKGDLTVKGLILKLNFEIQDPKNFLQDGLTVGTWDHWERADELWKTTCFEAFLGVVGTPKYWEINLSPSKQRWNCYAFDDCRSPQPPKSSEDFSVTKISATKTSLVCELALKHKLEKMDFSLTVVARTPEATHYFALSHAGPKPDFHLRKSFISET